ncbi:organic cation transporter protein-like isoform X2 [Ptychodera flava]
MLQYDDILKNILGEFGWYQKRNCILLCLMAVTVSIWQMSPVFLHVEVAHWCRVPGSEDILTECMTFNLSRDSCIETLHDLTIPKEYVYDNKVCSSVLKPSSCLRYDSDFLELELPFIDRRNFTNTSFNAIACDHGWEYDTRKYTSAVMQEFDLVCEKYYLGTLLTSIYMAGFVIGSFIFGPLSDRIGRLKSLLIAVCGLLVFGVISAFSQNLTMLTAFRFLTAICGTGIYHQSFVLATELVGPSKRPLMGALFMLMYATGYIGLGVMAFFVRSWRTLLLTMTLPNLVFLSYYCVLDESPRWLLSVGKRKKAEKIISKKARINGVSKSSSDELFALFTLNTEKEDIEVKSSGLKKAKRGRALDLVKYPNLRKKILIMCFSGFTAGLVYYGFSFNTPNLGGNEFINAGLAGAAEIPGNFLMLVLVKSMLGRRLTYFGVFILAGVASLSTVLISKCGDLMWLNTTVSMLGKCIITIAYNLSWVYAAELFPTPVRSLGVSMTSMSGMFASILAPQIIYGRVLWIHLPQCIFGIMPLIAGFLALLLPETRGKKLPETIEDGEAFGRKQRCRRQKTLPRR